MLWLPRIAVTSCVTSRAEAASKRERRSRMSEFWFRTLPGDEQGQIESDGAQGGRLELEE